MIICCGEALIDMVPVVSLDEQASFAPLVGGAIFNTAIGLGRLGAKVGMMSGVSTDLFGTQLQEALEASKVDTSYLVKLNAPTTLAFVTLNNGQASYTFYDENSAGRSLSVKDVPKLCAVDGEPKPSALYFGGISLINDPAASAYCTFAEDNAKDTVIVLDPNIRTSFITNEEAYRDGLQRIIDVADIIKVSDEDLDWLIREAEDEASQVAALRGETQAIIVVTKGADGATAHLASGEQVHQGVPKVVVVDTVGAGDTFNSGLLAKLLELGVLSKSKLSKITSDQMQQALAFGAQIAGVNVTRQGANPPWLSEL